MTGDAYGLEALLHAAGFLRWQVVDVDTLECPCGFEVTHDGTCPAGHVSPLVHLGIVGTSRRHLPATTLAPVCAECGRRFDLLDQADAAEWTAGHDCEV